MLPYIYWASNHPAEPVNMNETEYSFNLDYNLARQGLIGCGLGWVYPDLHV